MVGSISSKNSVVTFSYINENVNAAKQYGFHGYPGLSLDQKDHTDNVLELFSKRLISLDREESSDLLEFWEVNPEKKGDILYMLAMTQGKMQTDTFEFLASFRPVKELVFVTDVAGIKHHNFDLGKIKVGDQLSFEKDPNNPNDKKAIKILYKQETIGYIKKGHNEVFHGNHSKNLKIIVKSITNTPVYKDLYIKIYPDIK
ncbi:MAG: HIRAN domain-containing protein [Macellibacteroides fermentans]|uniref:HIRAN domain-containing protein n=1 Tax=Macellibacteroides fermentans TaxID=879969 RepID=UPI003ACC9145